MRLCDTVLQPPYRRLTKAALHGTSDQTGQSCAQKKLNATGVPINTNRPFYLYIVTHTQSFTATLYRFVEGG